MPRKTTTKKKTTKVDKVEIPKGIPPKPLEKLKPGQVIYCWNPTDGYRKRVYEKDYKEAGWVVCRDEKGQGWIVNLEHLHNTILTEEEYEKLGPMDKRLGRLP